MQPARRNNRLAIIACGGILLAGAAALTLSALSSNVSFFMTPSELAELDDPVGRSIRLGGLVEDGSVVRGEGVEIRFQVTDGAGVTDVVYRDVLPDLFREGQGVIAEGTMGVDGVFQARRVLAKHDENYVPKELKNVLEGAEAAS